MNSDTRSSKMVLIERSLSEGKAERVLRESEEFFGLILGSTTDCILLWDEDYNCLYANQAAAEYAGATREQMIGNSIRKVLGHVPDLMRLWMRRTDMVLETGRSFRIEDVMSADDKIIRRESVLCPMRDAEGNIFAAGVLYRHVLESKPAARRTPEAQEL